MFLLLSIDKHSTKACVVWEKFSELNVNGDLMATGFKEPVPRRIFGLVLAMNIL